MVSFVNLLKLTRERTENSHTNKLVQNKMLMVTIQGGKSGGPVG